MIVIQTNSTCFVPLAEAFLIISGGWEVTEERGFLVGGILAVLGEQKLLAPEVGLVRCRL